MFILERLRNKHKGAGQFSWGLDP